MDFYYITIGSVSVVMILALFVPLVMIPNIQKNDQKLIREDAINQGIKGESIKILPKYRLRFHYHVLYIDDQVVGHVRRCMVYKKMVYWYDRI